MAQSIKQQEWKKNEYNKNKDKHRLKQQERRKQIRILVESLKSPCVICGESDKCCIDFHHKNPDEKDFQIADVGIHKWGNKRIIEEIEKCVSICSNHHRQLHFYNLTIEELIERYKKN